MVDNPEDPSRKADGVSMRIALIIMVLMWFAIAICIFIASKQTPKPK